MTLIEKLRAVARNGSKSLRDIAAEAADELEVFEKTFELRWDADMRAARRWRATKPGRDLTLPDHADLCVFLLNELERLANAPLPDQAWRDSAWLGLSASERACYHWPDDSDLHKQCRAAYIAGATDYTSQPADSAHDGKKGK